MESVTQFTKKREKEILAVLEKVGVLNVCPICRLGRFQLHPGYFVNIVQQDIKTVELGGEAIPTVVLTCRNCGFVSQHSLGELGLLPESKSEETDG